MTRPDRRVNRIYRRNELPPRVGMRQTQIDEAIKDEEFPEPVVLRDGGRAIGFFEDEIISWQEYRRAKRDEVFKGNWKQWQAERAPTVSREGTVLQ